MGDVGPIGNDSCSRRRGVGTETKEIAIFGRCAVRALKQVAGIERRVHGGGS